MTEQKSILERYGFDPKESLINPDKFFKQVSGRLEALREQIQNWTIAEIDSHPYKNAATKDAVAMNVALTLSQDIGELITHVHAENPNILPTLHKYLQGILKSIENVTEYHDYSAVRATKATPQGPSRKSLHQDFVELRKIYEVFRQGIELVSEKPVHYPQVSAMPGNYQESSTERNAEESRWFNVRINNEPMEWYKAASLFKINIFDTNYSFSNFVDDFEIMIDRKFEGDGFDLEYMGVRIEWEGE